jgi:AAA family ATP:ADP antiporter
VPQGRDVTLTPREREALGWSFGLFFCVFASWYVVRPVRDALGLVGNVRELSRLFLVTLGVSLALAPIVSALVSRLPPGRFISIAYRVALASLVLFAALLRGAEPSVGVARAFFVWASVLNLFLITLAWGLMADVFSRDQGIRFFALIGGGGTLGAMLGSLATTAIVARSGAPAALVFSAVLLEGAARCAHRAGARATATQAGYSEGGVLRWLRGALTSPYFLGISAYLAFFTFSSTVLYLEQARIVKSAILDTSGRAELFAHIDLAANALTLVLQLGVAGRTLRFIGVGAALATLPLCTFVCFVALRAAPILLVLVVCQVARRALDFAIAKPAREVLFTVVQPADKYKAKSFIDTFVYRGGDAFAAVSFDPLSASFLVGTLALVCGVWAVLGFVLGRSNPS